MNIMYVAYSVPIIVTVNNNTFNFNQLGSNSPQITLYRGTNYDFIIQEPSCAFALRNTPTDTINIVSGTYNNNINDGVSSDTVMFTPDSDTPNEIYYVSTTNSNLVGNKILIQDYA